MSKTGNFVLSSIQSPYLTRAVEDDLILSTSDSTQHIVVGCGTEATLSIDTEGIDFFGKKIKNAIAENFTLGAGFSLTNLESSTGMSFTASNGDINIKSILNGDIILSTSDLARLTVTDGGYIGIGTAIPIAPFQVADISLFNSNVTVQGTSTLNGTVQAQTNLFVAGNVGIGTNALIQGLNVNGNVLTTAGTVGPTLLIMAPMTYVDIPSNNMFPLDETLEPGNPATSRKFVYNKFLGVDGSGENASWKRARFILRGVLLSDTTLSSDMRVERFNISTSEYSTAATFTIPNIEGMSSGYKFIIGPWFTLTSTDGHFALFNASAHVFRISSVHMHFA